MKTVVCKFGGTSLADAGQFKKVKAIIQEDARRRIVVASAPGKRFPEDIKVTDLLIECYNKASQGEDYKPVFLKIKARFQEIIDELQVEYPLEEEMKAIEKKLQESPEKDYIESRGEYLNSGILAKYLGYTFVDPEWCVCFDPDGEFNHVVTSMTMGAALRPLTNAVVAGFYGADRDGKIHTFSRGGSDITGSLAAQAIDAELYENWTDVSGLLGADPNIVDHPRPVEYISYRELRTLSYMGASVLHTDAVLPISGKGIPINIRNTNEPQDPGTMIVKRLKDKGIYHITGVAGRKGMSVIQVEKIMVSDGAGFSAIMLDILKNRKLPFEQCLTGIDTITLVIRSDLLAECKEDLLEEIRNTLNPDFIGVKENLSMIAVVGEKPTERSDANVRVLYALASAGIEISTINQGAGKLNLLIGVPNERYEDAIRVIYKTVD